MTEVVMTCIGSVGTPAVAGEAQPHHEQASTTKETCEVFMKVLSISR